jgi:predicted ATP-dependent protease
MRRLDAILHEAHALAESAGRRVIGAEDVGQALSARRHRHDRMREQVHDAMLRQTLMISTDGRRCGQVNALAVAEVGDHRFGHPLRVTATARLGDGHLVDIEREATLGGPIHTKGVMILSAYLASRYAPGQPLSLSASLVFEQSYDLVEGDSASLAELCAFLSALAGVPVDQSLAVTGSINQFGQVQAIGGVNEKIEGFFDLCHARGLTGRQGVVVPSANVAHLMLRADVLAAAREGRFHVWAVDDVDQALERLTGLEAGTADARGRLPEGSVNQRVVAQLAHFVALRQSLDGSRHGQPGRRPRATVRTQREAPAGRPSPRRKAP